MCRRGAPCGCGQSGQGGWLAGAVVVLVSVVAGAAWLPEVAAVAGGVLALAGAGSWLVVRRLERRMILVWRPAALSRPVSVVSVRPVRSPVEVADRERAAIESGRIEG